MCLGDADHGDDDATLQQLQALSHMLTAALSGANRALNAHAVFCNSMLRLDGLETLQVRSFGGPCRALRCNNSSTCSSGFAQDLANRAGDGPAVQLAAEQLQGRVVPLIWSV